MLMKSSYLLSCLSLLISSLSFAAIQKKSVVYHQGDTAFEGMLVYPDDLKGPAPGILMVHNWMGVSSETETQAERMANLGFVVFAADIYGQGVRPQDASEAGKLATIYKTDRTLYRERLALGLETLKVQPGVDPSRIWAVGYCFGGTGVIELARSGADVLGIVSFHGGLDSPTPDDGANIRGKVLILHGADDPNVSADDLAAFENEMRTHKVDWQLIKYGGAVHSFTEKGAGSDPSTGSAYNEHADLRSFQAFKDFVAEGPDSKK